MSLYKQLAVFTSTLFVLMFCGTLWVNFHSTQEFLIKQLETQSQDTATSLGLSLVPYFQTKDFQTNDTAAMQTTVNAIFDNGYYQEIIVEDNQAKVLAKSEQTLAIHQVPQWFVNLMQLESPMASSQIMAGWSKAGKVTVQSHTGYAYQQLWQIITESLLWFVLAFLILAIAGHVALKRLLQPLTEVTRQAEAICSRHYDIQLDLPKTPELRIVVSAINRMSNMVKKLFDEQAKVAARLREMAYQDPLTALGNQRYFKSQLENLLQDSVNFQQGALFLIRIDDMRGYNHRQGLSAGDKVIIAFGKIISTNAEAFDSPITGHISGADFALFVANVDQDKAESIAIKLSDEFSRLRHKGLYDSDNISHIGLLMVEQREEISTVLSRADNALRSAESHGANTWFRFQSDNMDVPEIAGRHSWLKHLGQVIMAKKVTLLTQKVVDCHLENNIYHVETFTQILDQNNKPCPAGSFMSSAEQLGIAQEIDRIVIGKVTRHLINEIASNKDSIVPFAINLSLSSLLDLGFLNWVFTRLEQLPVSEDEHGFKPIFFEFSESIAVKNLSRVREFATTLQQMGYGIGLDQFGRGFSDFGYLRTLKPAYVKIDGAYTRQLQDDIDNQFFVSTLCNISRSLNIKVIAQAVEQRQQWETLKDLNVDAIQGHIVAEPEVFEI